MRIPQNVNFLERGIRALVDSNDKAYRLRVMMANVVVGQFLRDGVLRGGTSMKLRYGANTTRFTMDFDVARKTALEAFMSNFAERLKAGWGEFDGFVVKAGEKHPRGVPAEYVMHPYDVKLQYRHHPWCTVRFEVSYDEIGDADEFELVSIPTEISDAFLALGFPTPDPIPVMPIPFQIAQKLHGLTEPGGHRVQDLVDLQLMVANEPIDFQRIRQVCVRLFANRKMQSWPPMISKGDDWASLYDAAKVGISGIRPLDEAVDWATELISMIDTQCSK